MRADSAVVNDLELEKALASLEGGAMVLVGSHDDAFRVAAAQRATQVTRGVFGLVVVEMAHIARISGPQGALDGRYLDVKAHRRLYISAQVLGEQGPGGSLAPIEEDAYGEVGPKPIQVPPKFP